MFDIPYVIDKDLWEVHTRLENGIARVFFTVDGKYMILLHGFIKKSQKTPQNELKTALTRLGNYKRGKPTNVSITLQTLESAALALGKSLKVELA